MCWMFFLKQEFLVQSALDSTMGRREEHGYRLDERIWMNSCTPRHRRLSLPVKGKQLLIFAGLQAMYQMLQRMGKKRALLMEIQVISCCSCPIEEKIPQDLISRSWLVQEQACKIRFKSSLLLAYLKSFVSAHSDDKILRLHLMPCRPKQVSCWEISGHPESMMSPFQLSLHKKLQ